MFRKIATHLRIQILRQWQGKRQCNAMPFPASDHEDQSDPDLEILDHQYLPALHRAKAELETRHKKRMECSKPAAKAVGKGSVNHAQNLQRWVVAYMKHGSLLLNRYGGLKTSILDDEDLAQQIHLHLI